MLIGDETPDFDDPFAILEACHGRIRRFLSTATRLAAHLRQHGVDDEAREAIMRIRRYFDEAAPDHHADEEIDLFPELRKAATAAALDHVLVTVDALEAQHAQMAQRWSALRAEFDRVLEAGAGAVSGAGRGPDPMLDQQIVDAFVRSYSEHIEREEAGAFGPARKLLDEATRSRLGARMVARRRG